MKVALDNMPGWPARMTAPVAAAYMGVSQTTFLERFRSIAVREGGSVLWAKVQLDRIIEKQFGIDPAPADEFSLMPTMDNAYDQWKAGRQKG